jgi:hypothetical protein
MHPLAVGLSDRERVELSRGERAESNVCFVASIYPTSSESLPRGRDRHPDLKRSTWVMIWSIAYPHRPFPYRRNVPHDFGPSKFGRFPPDPPWFMGRRVDMLGRSLPAPPQSDPVSALRRYLRNSRTKSARLLAEKA